MPPRLVGINHVALEVRDLEEALEFWGGLFDISVEREPEYRMAFIDMGDQFLALSEGGSAGADSARHFGLVVDDKEAVRSRLVELGVEVSPGRRLNFRDPSGNLIQVVEYGQIQFTKADPVLRGMGLDDLEKTQAARTELAEKGLT
jgi:catechol 2,3-dioxygenase-like lactoylglutathione lyase family enzyme